MQLADKEYIVAVFPETYSVQGMQDDNYYKVVVCDSNHNLSIRTVPSTEWKNHPELGSLYAIAESVHSQLTGVLSLKHK
jgi:hypothetical protein